MNDPTKKASRLATAMRGAKPNTKLNASSPCQKGAAGNHTANCPMATTMKFMRKPIQIISRALRKPQTSAMQSLIMYDTGKTIRPAVTDTGPS